MASRADAGLVGTSAATSPGPLGPEPFPPLSRDARSSSRATAHRRQSTPASPRPPSPFRHALPPSQALSPRSHSPDELARFIDVCRAAYFEQSLSAMKQVDETVRNQPSHARSAFIKAQGAVRVQYHAEMAQQRQEKLDKALVDIQPGSVIRLSVGVDADAIKSGLARRERQRHMARFLSSHALRSHPGPHPFLRSLYAALSIQCLPVTNGGAGVRLVEWDVDEAVFQEAGADFLRDSVELLKGILGMDDHLRAAAPTSYSYAAESDRDHGEDDLVSATPFSAEDALMSCDSPPADFSDLARPASTVRDRSSSDPFSDPPDAVASAPTASATSPTDARGPPRLSPSDAPSLRHPPCRVRTFTLPPYLTNPELEDLASLFPVWVRSSSAVSRALEEGSAGGHGQLRIGQRRRDEGFEGGALERFVHWLKRLLHLS